MRPRLTIVLVSALAIAALGGFWRASHVAQRLRQAESAIATARINSDRLEADRAATSAEVQQTIENLLHQTERLQQPMSAVTVEQFRICQAFLHRQVLSDGAPTTPAPFRAKAFYLLARIAQKFGQLGEAEAAYRESSQILGRAATDSPLPEVLLGKTITDNALACLQASIGKAKEAEQTLRALAQQQFANPSPLMDAQQATLALVCRNLSVVVASQGGDGIPLIERSIAITQGQVDRIADSVSPAEFLADSLQVLAELQWRHGKLDAALATCRRTLATIERVRASVSNLSNLSRQTPPSLHHGQAIDMLRVNMTWLEATRNAGTAESTAGQLGHGWRWRPLQPMPAETVSTGILLAGRLPAEFEHQDALLVTWLDRPWSADVLVQIVAATWRRIQIIVLVESDLLELQAKRAFHSANIDTAKIQFYHVPTDTIWARDWGPLVVATAPHVAKWIDPISTGDLNFPRYRDDHVPSGLSQIVGAASASATIFLHGGGILGNGSDVCCVSTSQLDWNQQLGIGEQHVTRTLRRITGAQQLIYLEPLVGEPTEHLDWFMTFPKSDTVVVGEYGSGDPVNARLLDRHAELLSKVTTQNGPLQVERIPMPPRGEDYFGGTYTNVVYANGVMLMPTWPSADAANREALAVYRRLLPDWEVVGIDCEQLVKREGALHCATRNIYRLP